MKLASQVRIIDITKNTDYEKHLYRCLAPMPFRKFRGRQEYLEKAIPKGFHKKLLFFNSAVVGMIEYAPAEVSAYPIHGERTIVMNCIWVLRKAKGHDFGKLLLEDMVRSEEDAASFATIALENHFTPWFKKWQMEKLGFKPLESFKVAHKTKHREQTFTISLMWMRIAKNAKPPTWDPMKLLEGITFCTAHPLYRPQKWKGNVFEAR